jgi:hypothetical protein
MLSTADSSCCDSTEKRCENVAGVADSMKKLGGCSVTPASAAEFDWSVGIFARTATQSGLAANAAAKQVNCQILIEPLPRPCPEFFYFQGSTRLAFFFVAQRAFVSTGAIFAETCGISATIPQSQARLLSHEKVSRAVNAYIAAGVLRNVTEGRQWPGQQATTLICMIFRRRCLTVAPPKSASRFRPFRLAAR